jgi:hypothetical protein
MDVRQNLPGQARLTAREHVTRMTAPFPDTGVARLVRQLVESAIHPEQSGKLHCVRAIELDTVPLLAGWEGRLHGTGLDLAWLMCISAQTREKCATPVSRRFPYICMTDRQESAERTRLRAIRKGDF